MDGDDSENSISGSSRSAGVSANLPGSLAGLLQEGQKAFASISAGECASVDAADRAVAVLDALQLGVSREGMFSVNEELDDVSTEALPFLATDCYLGMVLLRRPCSSYDPRQRVATLERADALLSRYLDTCERMKLLQGPDLAAWRESFAEGAREQLQGVGAGRPDDGQLRQRKIDRFKRQRATEEKLKSLLRELENIAGSDEEDSGLEEVLGREKGVLLLQTLAGQALDELESISKEKPMLMEMAKRIGAGGVDEKERDDERLKQKQNAMDENRKGLQVTHVTKEGGRYQMRKEEIKARVFQPTVAPPTMTLEEFADIEVKEAMERAEREKNAPKADRRYDQLLQDGDEDDEQLLDIATHKDRAWDDWKEDNPRGSGNKANKII